jgi:hypothetical protein
MKLSTRKLFVFFAIVLSFTAVQAVRAATLEVTGTIDRIGERSIDVLEDEETIYTFYDIPLSDLEDKNIILGVDDSVTISAYVVTFRNGMVKNIAYSITVGDVTYTWHPNVPKAGPTDLSSATAAADCTCDNCNCACPEDCQDCSCECPCDCTCDGTGPNGPKGAKN